MDAESILKPRLLDLQVFLEKLELFVEHDAGGIRPREGDTEQIAQAADHPVGGVRLGMNQRRDRVKRVEEEVRVQLRFERLQPCLREARFELRGADGARP